MGLGLGTDAPPILSVPKMSLLPQNKKDFFTFSLSLPLSCVYERERERILPLKLSSFILFILGEENPGAK